MKEIRQTFTEEISHWRDLQERKLFNLTFIVAVLLTGCGSHRHQAVFNDTITVKVEMFYNQSKYDSIFYLYAPDMQKAFPLNTTVNFFEVMKIQKGNMIASRFEKFDEGWAFYNITCVLNRCSLKISTDLQGKVNGLAIVPLTQDSSSKYDPLPQTIYNYIDPIDSAYTACNDIDPTTIGLCACAEQAEKVWEKEMNKYYQLVLKQCKTTTERKALQNSQDSWLACRNADIQFRHKYYNRQGTIWSIVSTRASMDLVKSRALQLRGYNW